MDRGQFGIEILLTLASIKIKFPNKIFMIRGNHETRHMTTCFNFFLECTKKYDNDVYE